MKQPDAPSRSVMSVSQLTHSLQSTLRMEYGAIWVKGEISNLSRPQSGHVYLSLSDDQAQLKAVAWKNTARSLAFDLEEGLEVICYGEIDIYPPRGTYQLIIRKLELLGQGALQLAFKKLHQKLNAEGLFDSDRKRPLPLHPQRIGIVSSPTGAAIRDFLQVTTRRWPNLQFYILPCRVQGSGAAIEIAQAVDTANRLQPALDVIVVTRGGGSAEDLWAFNEEPVVRAVANSRLPVLSAIGHEIDLTLCDLAADVRALTPSEAGELVVSEKRPWVLALEELQQRLVNGLQSNARLAKAKLNGLATRRVLQHPTDRIRLLAEKVDELDLRMRRAMNQETSAAHQAAENLCTRLHAISPLQVLSRGYSVTQTADGTAIRQSAQVHLGETITTKLDQGEIQSVVQSIAPHPDDT